MTEGRDDQRVLITGGGGFLGRALLRELAKPEQRAVRVRVFDLDVSSIETSSSIEAVPGDV